METSVQTPAGQFSRHPLFFLAEGHHERGGEGERIDGKLMRRSRGGALRVKQRSVGRVIPNVLCFVQFAVRDQQFDDDALPETELENVPVKHRKLYMNGSS